MTNRFNGITQTHIHRVVLFYLPPLFSVAQSIGAIPLRMNAVRWSTSHATHFKRKVIIIWLNNENTWKVPTRRNVFFCLLASRSGILFCFFSDCFFFGAPLFFHHCRNEMYRELFFVLFFLSGFGFATTSWFFFYPLFKTFVANQSSWCQATRSQPPLAAPPTPKPSINSFNIHPSTPSSASCSLIQ